MRYYLLVLLLFGMGSLWGQVNDSFDDGEFTSNPEWTGDTADFIINSNKELQLWADAAGESWISTRNELTQLEDREWRFRINYLISPSGSNGGDTYLTATDSILSNKPDGIYFHIGETGSDDAINLYERQGGTSTLILKSTPGIVAHSFNINVKIVYHAGGLWELYIDPTGGTDFLLDASANYTTTALGDFFGVDLEYTSTRVHSFIYDDFYVGGIQSDTVPPVVDTVYAINAHKVGVLFNEPVDSTSGVTVGNYQLSNGIGQPIKVEEDSTNANLFILTLGTPLTVGDTYQLKIMNVQDVEGNPMVEQEESFMYLISEKPNVGDVIINEFMADETPSIGLPQTEYVEIYNRSNKYFNLKDWKLRDNSSDGKIQDYWLKPGKYALLVPSGAGYMFPSFTNVVEVTSWASLNNSGDEIHLVSDSGKVVDELSYSSDWYSDPVKADGGWSMERINPDLPCSNKNNWTASINPNGGTPGEKNSVYNDTPDTDAPTVISSQAELPNKLTLYFSEGVDSTSLVNATFSNSFALIDTLRVITSNNTDSLVLYFDQNFARGISYNFHIKGFLDCSGNIGDYSGVFMIPQAPQKGDIIINEILYNPLTGGSDFIELYNNSDKYIDLKGWELARWYNDTISSNEKVNKSYLLHPYDYVVLTQDSTFQLKHYPFAVSGKFIQQSIPSYNNDSSTVYLIYHDTVMDKVSYTDDWQYSLLESHDGVSLERFSPDLPSNKASSWHSASTAVSYATPGRKNSQTIYKGNEGGTLELSSNTLSPDADGFEDAVLITYHTTSPNLLGDMVIYDDKGRKIRTLFQHHLLDTEGTIQWDGVREDGTKANIGPYIILFKVFDVNNGLVSKVKKVVTVAGKL